MKNNPESDKKMGQIEPTKKVQTTTRARLDLSKTIDLSAEELTTMLPPEWTQHARQKNIY